jgi:hypothetical protein
MEVTAKKFGPKIVYIIDIHNTVADAIPRLEYDPSINQTAEKLVHNESQDEPKMR